MGFELLSLDSIESQSIAECRRVMHPVAELKFHTGTGCFYWLQSGAVRRRLEVATKTFPFVLKECRLLRER